MSDQKKPLLGLTRDQDILIEAVKKHRAALAPIARAMFEQHATLAIRNPFSGNLAPLSQGIAMNLMHEHQEQLQPFFQDLFTEFLQVPKE